MTIRVAGTAPVSPIGIGNKEFIAALHSGSSGIRMSDRWGVLCGEIATADVDTLLKDRRFRRAAPFSRFALLAVKLALEDAGLSSIAGTESALAMATMHGASNYTEEFHRALVTEGVEGASPILFSDSVLNAAAGNLSLCYGIRGPAHTLIGGQTAFFKALQLGSELLARHSATTVVVAASEELSEIELSCYSRLGAGPLAEGGGAMVLMKEADASAPGCRILGAASWCDPADSQEAVRHAIDSCLGAAALCEQEIDLIISDLDSHCCGRFPVPCVSLSQQTGNAFSASAVWQAIVAVRLLSSDGCMSGLLQGAVPTGALKRILLCAADAGGIASAVIIGKV